MKNARHATRDVNILKLEMIHISWLLLLLYLLIKRHLRITSHQYTTKVAKQTIAG